MIGPLIALILGDPGMADRILSVHVDDGRGRCAHCVVHNRPAAEHPCTHRAHALHALAVRGAGADGRT